MGKMGGKYLCGDEMSVPDFYLYYAMWNVQSGNVDYVDKNVFEKVSKDFQGLQGR